MPPDEFIFTSETLVTNIYLFNKNYLGSDLRMVKTKNK